MKHMWLPFITCLITATVPGQTKDHQEVAEVVKSAFRVKYPGESDPDWEVDRNGNYESHFKKHGKHYRADFTPQGQWIETERSIKKEQLPKPVRHQLKKNFDDYEIIELEEVQSNEKGFFYDVEIKKEGKKRDIEFTKDGEIIN